MIIGNKISHYINGQDLGEPRNWENLEIEIDFLNKKESANINISELNFVLKANKYLQKRVLDGLTGGVGIFEGEQYQIKIGDRLNPTYTFNGFLDFTESSTIIGGEEFSCSLKKSQGEDWLNDVADSFSFAYLASIKKINTSDYVKVPYVINYVPDGMQLIVLSMSIYMMVKELIENIQRISDTIADITDAAVPVIGVGVGFGAVVVTAWDIGNFILVILKIAVRIVYTIAITIAIIKLVQEVLEQVLPKKRDHLGMQIKTLFEKGCNYLGLTFSSKIQELEWVHIPAKDKKGGEKGEVGHPENGGVIYTFGDCIRVFKKMFNADYKIVNGIFYFERLDSFEVPSNYKLPDYFNDQDRLLDRVKFNADEMISNYNIAWSYDTQDQNTLDDQEGRVFQAITTPVVINNIKNINIKNLADISLPFSLGKHKDKLNDVEKLAKDLGKIVDKLTGIFGGGTNFAAKITDRVGSLLLSSHFLTIGKIVKMSGGKLSKDQRNYLSSKILWNKYHFINSFAEVNGRHNQFWRYENVEIPMDLESFSKIIDNNLILDNNGNRVMIEKLIYTPQKGRAKIDYRINKKYTNNLKIEYV